MKPINEVANGLASLSSPSPVTLPASSAVTSPTAQCLFRDQLATLTNWFDQWNGCEQTVALYSLLNKLNASQARFLSYSIQHILVTNEETQRLEKAANNLAFISSLQKETKENAITTLLEHLPLLHPGNEDCKSLYLSLITKILGHSVANSAHLEESRQLLSYALIHPALTSEDRRMLKSYYRKLDDLLSPNHDLIVNGKDISKMNTYQCANGQSNNFHQNFSTSNNELLSTSNNYNSWQTNSHALGNRASMNLGASLHYYGSNSLPTGITPAQMAHYNVESNGMQKSQEILLNGSNQNSALINNNNSMRSKRSKSLTPTTNGNVNGSLKGFAMRFQKPFHSDASTFLGNCNYNNNHQQDWINANANQNESFRILKNIRYDHDSHDSHNTLSPQHSLASSGSGSDNCLAERKSTFELARSGMKDVPCWLKCLRLHKYSALFSTLTYDQMLNLTENELERLNVTKGARHKIILNIRKLNERPQLIRSLEKELEEEGVKSFRQTLLEIRQLLTTPIKPYENGSQNYSIDLVNSADKNYNFNNNLDLLKICDNTFEISDDDLPTLIFRLLAKIYFKINDSPSQVDEDSLKLFLNVVEKCCAHEAFTSAQAKYLCLWEQKVQKILECLPIRRLSDGRQNRGKLGQNFCNALTNSTFGKIGPNNMSNLLTMSVPPRKRSPSFSSNLDLSQQQPKMFHDPIVINNNSDLLSMNCSSRSSLQDEINTHPHINRTSSAPIRRTTESSRQLSYNRDPTDREQLNDIETLCIRMTEQALG